MSPIRKPVVDEERVRLLRSIDRRLSLLTIEDVPTLWDVSALVESAEQDRAAIAAAYAGEEEA